MNGTRTTLVRYRDSAFHGGAVSWAAQGWCSANDNRHATYMLVNKHGAALRALCDEHAERWRKRHRPRH